METKTFMVVAVSRRRNAFGLNGVVLLAKDGKRRVGPDINVIRPPAKVLGEEWFDAVFKEGA